MNGIATIYLLLLAGHFLAVIAWMAGLLYLPRLFVYHAATATRSATSETFKVMERRLYRGIMTPAMIATWLFGLALASLAGLADNRWLLAKLVLVIFMTVMHFLFNRWRRAFAADIRRNPAWLYRVMNEVPTVLLIGIVILAVVKPF